MEDIVSEITAQALNQLAERREVMLVGAQFSPEEEAMLAAALEGEHQEIPVNSQTITVDETTSRFSGAIWYEEIQKQTVTLAGVGGIGRFGNLVNFYFP